LDITEKVDLIERPPTEEVVTHEELIELFKTNSSPKHYIGLEISGFLHLGSLISTGFKINDFVKAGVNCTIFLADWHTMINDKLGGDWDTITKVSKYYADAFKLVCPDANIVLGSDLYDSRKEYWKEFMKFTKHMSLKRTMRTLTIMGRSEDESKIDLAKLLYPPMQAVDIHSLDLDIVHAGMDQRKIHMLVREIFPKMNWKVPIAVHHKLLPGLTKPEEQGIQLSDGGNLLKSDGGKILLSKMSKSDPNSGVFIHDSDDEIKKKISKAWTSLMK
jgi:tyrosyl-tRNA synthetase